MANGAMRMDAFALAGIMQCTITQWNDPHLASLNPNVTYDSIYMLLSHNKLPAARVCNEHVLSLQASTV